MWLVEGNIIRKKERENFVYEKKIIGNFYYELILVMCLMINNEYKKV